MTYAEESDIENSAVGLKKLVDRDLIDGGRDLALNTSNGT